MRTGRADLVRARPTLEELSLCSGILRAYQSLF